MPRYVLPCGALRRYVLDMKGIPLAPYGVAYYVATTILRSAQNTVAINDSKHRGAPQAGSRKSCSPGVHNDCCGLQVSNNARVCREKEIMLRVHQSWSLRG